MKRNVYNIIIDSLSLLVFTSMISTGLLLKFVLPPGSGRIEMLTRGHGQIEKTIDVFWGLTRHEWGEIHFYISLAFFVFLLIHLMLHWAWIKATFWGVIGHPQTPARKWMAIGIIVFIVVMLLLPWLGTRQTYTKSEFIRIRQGK